MTPIQIYNTLTRRKESFEPIKAPHVGMYVCGPTVYGDAHLGHARPAITFDTVFRYLTYLGYKVRYVRNITDVGHLENDADQGEDKIAKKARLEQLEPMEVVQYYTDRYHRNMDDLNILSPSIEPRASGHIIEQIKMIQAIIDNGFAYVANGSVYFDVLKYNANHHYGKLSGRIIEDLLANTRDLDGQGEKVNSLDFALWKKALPMHIMRWPSPWSEGFPGWHIECSAMSSKYLGEVFDIHGGGMDLLFPHHECEIAQSQASHKHDPAKYWMHNNMITINGQKMGKSLGNFITLDQLFTGEHPLLEKAYSPMTIRFFILQSQYRSTLDFSNDALAAAEKGYRKVMNGLRTLNNLQHTADINLYNESLNNELIAACDATGDGLNDDFNTAVTLAAIFNLLKYINSFKGGQLQLPSVTEEAFYKLKSTFNTYVSDILGLKEETRNANQTRDNLMELIMQNYTEAKARKDYASVDKIRADLKAQGIIIKDSKTVSEWALEE